MNANENTPRTDEVFDGPEDGCPAAELCRTLERELNAAKQEVDLLRKQLADGERQGHAVIDRAIKGVGQPNRYFSVEEMLVDQLRQELDSLRQQLSEAKKDKERLDWLELQVGWSCTRQAIDAEVMKLKDANTQQ